MLSLRRQCCLYCIIAIFREPLLSFRHHAVSTTSVLSLLHHCCPYVLHFQLWYICPILKAISLNSENSHLLNIEMNSSLITIMKGSNFSAFPPLRPPTCVVLPYSFASYYNISLSIWLQGSHLSKFGFKTVSSGVLTLRLHTILQHRYFFHYHRPPVSPRREFTSVFIESDI